MDNLHLLILSLRDEVVENWNMVLDCVTEKFPRKINSVGVATGDLGQDSDGRVWVELGRPELRLRVIHLHPANPAVAEAVNARLSGVNEERPEENIIRLPSEDEISLASLEDYWFNHWQGPFISADPNQNNVMRLSRRSLRNSKRKFHCSICQKKIIGAEGLHEEHQESPCFDGENVLAHVPSIKFETRSPNHKPEETSAVSSDDECMKPAISEEALSRYSASDEQLARAYRVLDNELRTSFTLFSEGVVTQDIVDGVSMNVNDGSSSPDAALRLAPPTHSPRQSRSCPCSPKLAGRNHSPKSNTNSPKPRSRSERSKFSLSSSLMAIHRQASNTLRPDFLRFDSSRGDTGGTSSKNGSQNNSLKHESKHPRSSIEALQNGLGESFLNFNQTGSFRGESGTAESSLTRNPLQESHSLPALKLSRMSLTYKGGVIVNQDKECAQSTSSDKTKLLSEGACALPSMPEDYYLLDVPTNPPVLLPDVIPRSEASCANQMSEGEASTSGTSLSFKEHKSNYYLESREGVINLGFDGHEESSDFTDLNEAIQSKVSEMESGSLNSRRGSLDSDVDIGHEVCQSPTEMNDTPSSSGPPTPATASPSLSLRARAVDHSAPNLQFPGVEEPEEEEVPYDHMQEARRLVFWWQKAKSNEDSEFCQNNTECRVKQKPLLLFLHGMGGSSDLWRQQLWYFVCCGYEVVAPDLLGHGLSSAPRDPSQYTFAQMLDHITLVFDLFIPQGRKCVVIGHGYGASLAAALARGCPASVRLVVLVSCGGPTPLIPNPPAKSMMYSYLATVLSPFLSCGCCSRDILYSPRGKHFAARTLSGHSVTPTPRYVLEYVAKGQNWPEGDVAFHRRITVPTLLLHGMKDDRVGLVEMCEMEKTIPRAFLEMIPGGGHDLMTDAPLEVCHAVHRFIKRWQHHL
ncbi:uncharacterized protein [Palaemon carinicauda]|uniref:uncharacterized protein isoform X2 n=1 Tax=Palaemon carinicauda TaxID=392227 RepID=UPI0035B64767